MSSVTVLGWLTSLIVSVRATSIVGLNTDACRPLLLLRQLLREVLPGQHISVSDAASGLTIQIVDGIINLESLIGGADRHTKTVLRSMDLDPAPSLEALLCALCLHITVKSHRKGAKARLAVVLATITKHVARLLDIRMHERTSENFSDLPLVRGARGLRPRKVPQPFKLALSAAARQSSNKREFAQGSACYQ
eukprot:3866195-Amphidinium_carterae.1